MRDINPTTTENACNIYATHMQYTSNKPKTRQVNADGRDLIYEVRNGKNDDGWFVCIQVPIIGLLKHRHEEKLMQFYVGMCPNYLC